ncbi:uncharacterized protein [Linepithema humile]|uniref:uncharacterized protein n=1 Tax=Linepithema humile TaxID=83485 RepID=UPI00351DC2A2
MHFVENTQEKATERILKERRINIPKHLMTDTTTDVDSDNTNVQQPTNKKSEQERQKNMTNILRKKLIASEAASVLKEQNLNRINVSASVETRCNENRYLKG